MHPTPQAYHALYTPGVPYHAPALPAACVQVVSGITSVVELEGGKLLLGSLHRPLALYQL